MLGLGLAYYGGGLGWHSAAGDRDMWAQLRRAVPGELIDTAKAHCLITLFFLMQ